MAFIFQKNPFCIYQFFLVPLTMEDMALGI